MNLNQVQNLYSLNQITKDEYSVWLKGYCWDLFTKMTKELLTNDSINYCWRFFSTVNYSEKKFKCTQAQAAKGFFNRTKDVDKKILINNLVEIKTIIDIIISLEK